MIWQQKIIEQDHILTSTFPQIISTEEKKNVY